MHRKSNPIHVMNVILFCSNTNKSFHLISGLSKMSHKCAFNFTIQLANLSEGERLLALLVGVLVLVPGDATSHTDVFISAYGYYWTYYHIV